MSAQKVNSGEENSSAALARIQAHNLSIASPALYQQAVRAYDLVCFKKSTIESRENPDVSAAIIFVDGTCDVMNKVGVCSMYVLRHVKERANWLKSLNTKQPPEKKGLLLHKY